MGEPVLERLALGEVLEHEPHLQEGPVLAPDRVDERPEPALLGLGRRLAEQERRGHLAVLSALFEVGGKTHVAHPPVLENGEGLREGAFFHCAQRVPGGVCQQVAAVGVQDGDGQRGLLYRRAQVQIGRGSPPLLDRPPARAWAWRAPPPGPRGVPLATTSVAGVSARHTALGSAATSSREGSLPGVGPRALGPRIAAGLPFRGSAHDKPAHGPWSRAFSKNVSKYVAASHTAVATAVPPLRTENSLRPTFRERPFHALGRIADQGGPKGVGSRPPRYRVGAWRTGSEGGGGFGGRRSAHG